MDKKVRIGVVGCGGIANGKHMPNLAKIPEVEMVAFCDIVVERAQKAAEKFGIRGLRVSDIIEQLPPVFNNSLGDR